MNKYEAPALIAAKFPEADAELGFVTSTGDIDQAMTILSKYTRTMIATRKFFKVQQCMTIASKIYEEGDAIVKNAVSNVYVYSFSVMSLCCNKAEWHIIQSKIPHRLYSIYLKQIMQSSC